MIGYQDATIVSKESDVIEELCTQLQLCFAEITELTVEIGKKLAEETLPERGAQNSSDLSWRDLPARASLESGYYWVHEPLCRPYLMYYSPATFFTSWNDLYKVGNVEICGPLPEMPCPPYSEVR